MAHSTKYDDVAKGVVHSARTARLCDNRTDDTSWDRRQKHRRAGLAAVLRAKDAANMAELISTGELLGDAAPQPPDPEDRACSKRQWERRMQAYRANVKTFVQQAT